MNITFNKDQYLELIKLVYLGSRMADTVRDHDVEEDRKVGDLEQYVYSFAKDFDLDEYVEYIEDDKMYYPTGKLDDDPEIEQIRDEYDYETLVDELVYLLARRDFIAKYSDEDLKKMSLEEAMKIEKPFIDKYDQEFKDHGIERLIIDSEKK